MNPEPDGSSEASDGPRREDPPWLQVSGILTTNDTIEAYDERIRLSDSAIHGIVDQFNSGRIPFNVNHSSTQNMRARAFCAWIEEQENGRLVVRFQCDVHPDDVHYMDQMRGMSFTTLEEIVKGQTGGVAASGQIAVAADAAWFNDQDVALAAGMLLGRLTEAPAVEVEASRLYQFSFVPDPKIIIDISEYVWQTIGTGVAASIVWDSIKMLWSRRRARHERQDNPPTAIQVLLTGANGSRIDAVIITESEEIARQAMASLPEAMNAIDQLAPGEGVVRSWTNEDGSGGTEWRWREP